MKSKTKTILKILVFFLIILCLIVGGVVGYLFLADIESVVPEEMKDKIKIIEETYEGRKVFSLAPKETETESTVIFYLHGGSYVAEASKEHWYFLVDLVEDTKAKVIMPDYPLTPKYNYKDVFAMIEPLYEEIIAQEDTEKFIVMGDGPLKENFENYAKSKGIQIEFTGMLEYKEMVKRLVNCDIAVNPISKGAAQSIINKVGDYAAAALPVINTQECEEYRKLVEDYQIGFNCENGNIIDISQKIEKLCEDKTLRENLGNNNRKLAEEKFDRENTYKKIINIILN